MQPLDGQPGNAHNLYANGLRAQHPRWNIEGCTVRAPNDEVTDAEKLVLTDDQHALSDERMEQVGEHRLERQTPGIMSLPRTPAASAPRSSTR